MGDTSFLDDTPAREPLIKFCVVPGAIQSLEVKEAEDADKSDRINISVQLYGDKMVREDGAPVPIGKRLSTTMFFPISTPEKLDKTKEKIKNLLLALYDVPLTGKEDAVYQSWPPQQKLGFFKPTPERPQPRLSFHALRARDWSGVRVMVQVRKGTDMDGNPRNEFNLLAASTKPAERKQK